MRLIPGIIHVDGTARPQIVRDAENPLYADILRHFRASSGLPVLINTSFNVHEEPIVNCPAECRKALCDERIDFVATEKAVYTKIVPPVAHGEDEQAASRATLS